MTDPFEQRCPHCHVEFNKPVLALGPDLSAEPTPSTRDVAICPACLEPSLFDEELLLRKPTAEELAELEKNLGYRLVHGQMRKQAQDDGRLPEGSYVGEETEGYDVVEIPLDIRSDGELEVGEIPPSLRELITPILEDIRLRMAADDIRRHVTNEVANHVLSVYGDEEASMPSIAVGALITLIRLCNESDDYLMSKLNDVEGLHGYVLGVQMAEDAAGMDILRKMAGFK